MHILTRRIVNPCARVCHTLPWIDVEHGTVSAAPVCESQAELKLEIFSQACKPVSGCAVSLAREVKTRFPAKTIAVQIRGLTAGRAEGIATGEKD